MHAGVSAETGFRLPVWGWLSLWAGLFVGGPVAAHYAAHGVVNGWHVALCVFLAINLLICGWEISLWRRIGDIERWFRAPRGSGDRPTGNLYTMPASLREVLSTRLWARPWLGYAYWDDGYADPKSFGFAMRTSSTKIAGYRAMPNFFASSESPKFSFTSRTRPS